MSAIQRAASAGVRGGALGAGGSPRLFDVQLARVFIVLAMSGFALRMRSVLRGGGAPGGFFEARAWSSVAGRGA